MTKPLPWLLMSLLLPLASRGAPRERMPERVLVVTGEVPAAVHLAAGQATVLVFEVAPLAEGTRVEGRAAVAVSLTERSLILFSEREVAEHEEAVLVARLADGSRLRFQLVSVPEEVDGRVLVRRSLEDAGPVELRSRLERCERERSGLEAMAAFLAEHGREKEVLIFREEDGTRRPSPGPVVFTRLVEDRASGVAFAVFTLAPERSLELHAPRLVSASGRELRLLHVFPALLAFAARDHSHLVLAFEASEEVPASARFVDAEGRALEVLIRVLPRFPPTR